MAMLNHQMVILVLEIISNFLLGDVKKIGHLPIFAPVKHEENMTTCRSNHPDFPANGFLQEKNRKNRNKANGLMALSENRVPQMAPNGPKWPHGLSSFAPFEWPCGGYNMV